MSTSLCPISGTGTSSRLSPGARSRFTKAGIVLLTASKLVERRPSAIIPFRACHSPHHFGLCPNGRNARARGRTNKTVDAALSFLFSFWKHARPLVDRARDNFFRLRDCVLSPDWHARPALALGILRHARSQGPSEFQGHRDDLRHRDALRELLLFLPDRARAFLRFRSGGVALFPSHRVHPPDVRQSPR